MGKAERRLDQDFDSQAIGPARLAFQPRDQCVDELHVAGRADFRDQNKVEPRAARDDFDDVTGAPFCVEAVDPHRHRFVSPIDLVEGGDGNLARFALQRRRDGVLKIEKYEIGRALTRLVEEPQGCRRHRQFGALQALPLRLDRSQGHKRFHSYSRWSRCSARSR
jgi:hypothetical protein